MHIVNATCIILNPTQLDSQLSMRRVALEQWDVGASTHSDESTIGIQHYKYVVTDIPSCTGSGSESTDRHSDDAITHRICFVGPIVM